ncbi:hypothetical protein [Aeromicrobium sp. IC_218]|uniref:hypothetical protein n=1 Tax=Aeromicrobium sp. IC_218 TaxID=2545468 RepID=UPI0010388A09|nr:hypothetical protein [Aeromicrobium sp. IC_218]TCI99522.1 hypothetical protein E0W78_07250 [Aeromicrobium sp. IC_218]
MRLTLSRRLATASTVAITAAAVAFAGTPAHAAPASTSSQTQAAAVGSVRVAVSHTLLNKYSSTVYANARVTYSLPERATVTSASGELWIGGKKRRVISLPTYNSSNVSFPRSSGAGVAQIRNIKAWGYYYSADYSTRTTFGLTATSNVFQIRRTIDSSALLKLRKSGSKIRVSGTKWRAIQPNGRWARVSQVLVQKKSGRKWKTIKKVRPKSNGSFKFSYRSSKKANYRALVKTTTSLQGGATRNVKI